jgi:hypothetical protein
LQSALKFDFAPEPSSVPRAVPLSANENKTKAKNEWSLWVVPRPSLKDRPAVALHPSCDRDVFGLFPGAKPLADRDSDRIVVARRFDDRLLADLEAGGKVLLLPDGQPRSLPLAAHWFLRGGPYLADHPLVKDVPRDLLLELQAFDLAGDVIPDVKYLQEIDPVFMLWDNHDSKQVKTHGLVYETRVGKGKLLVSALRHTGETNAAGRWLLDVFLKHLDSGPPPRHELSQTSLRHLHDRLHEERIDLVKSTWRFRPDPDNEGLKREWHMSSTKLDDRWKDIRVGKHWEAQGYPDLDGWAWYRLDVTIPDTWKGRDVYLTFDGVDDYYELFVNGKAAGKGGDLEKKITAFDEKRSHKITGLATPGAACTIAVRVNDFQGAGGIHRPVTLGTMDLASGVEFLR